MARDYYADAHEIAARLAESGHHGWSERIEAVIAEGATATEILMGIQFQLAELLESEAVRDEDASLLVSDLLRAVREAL